MQYEYETKYQAGVPPLPIFRGRVKFTSRGTGPDEIEKDAISKIGRMYGPMPIRVFELVRLET